LVINFVQKSIFDEVKIIKSHLRNTPEELLIQNRKIRLKKSLLKLVSDLLTSLYFLRDIFILSILRSLRTGEQ
jgi:hypothetical protein